MKKEIPAKKCLRVGITGGIGSGKTTVCRMFETLGIPVYFADDWAKRLTVEDADVKSEILKLLGPEAYTPEGAYNRAWVAGVVFSAPEKLAALNGILHPAVEKHAFQWHEARAAEGAPYTLKEAALMVESGSYKHLDFMIVVTAPEPLRVRRVTARDGVSEEQVLARIRRQAPESEKVALADFVIENDGRKSLIRQVWAIHRAICREISK